MLVSLMLVLGVSSAPAMAQATPPVVPSIPGLDKPADKLTDADLVRFVSLARRREVTVAQTASFLARLSTAQTAVVSDQVGIQSGIPVEEWRAYVARERRSQTGTRSRAPLTTPTTAEGNGTMLRP